MESARVDLVISFLSGSQVGRHVGMWPNIPHVNQHNATVK